MHVDHVGLAVKSLEEAIALWEEIFGYKQYTEIVVNKIQKVKVVFLKKKDSITIKLIEPTDETSPIYKLSKNGGGIHHLCFKCDNIDVELERLKDIGLRILASPQSGEAFENERIAFLYAKNGLNIELIDTDKRAKII